MAAAAAGSELPEMAGGPVRKSGGLPQERTDDRNPSELGIWSTGAAASAGQCGGGGGGRGRARPIFSLVGLAHEHVGTDASVWAALSGPIKSKWAFD